MHTCIMYGYTYPWFMTAKFNCSVLYVNVDFCIFIREQYCYYLNFVIPTKVLFRLSIHVCECVVYVHTTSFLAFQLSFLLLLLFLSPPLLSTIHSLLLNFVLLLLLCTTIFFPFGFSRKTMTLQRKTNAWVSNQYLYTLVNE